MPTNMSSTSLLDNRQTHWKTGHIFFFCFSDPKYTIKLQELSCGMLLTIYTQLHVLYTILHIVIIYEHTEMMNLCHPQNVMKVFMLNINSFLISAINAVDCICVAS
jgi:hypothetical protein